LADVNNDVINVATDAKTEVMIDEVIGTTIDAVIVRGMSSAPDHE
jgi:hypothetical protein